MPKRLILTLPMRGFSEVASFQNQPNQTTASIKNTVFLDPATSRFRLASRSGTELYDLFSFASGSTVGLPSLINNGTSNGPGDSPGVIQYPGTNCDPFTVSTVSPTMDICGAVGATLANNTSTGIITVTPIVGSDGSCTPVSLLICNAPCNDTSNSDCGGTIIGGPVLGPGGGPIVPPPGTPVPPTHCPPNCPDDQNKRPWLAVVPCAGGAIAGWVDQGIYNTFREKTLPVLKNGAGDCFKVTGQRSAGAGLPGPGQFASVGSFRTCASCVSGEKSCYTLFHRTWSCDTNSWSNNNTVVWTHCYYPSQVTALFLDPDISQVIDTWFWCDEGFVGGVFKQTWCFVRETAGDCTSDGQCAQGAAPPEAIALTAPKCDCPSYAEGSAGPFYAYGLDDLACAACADGTGLTEWDQSLLLVNSDGKTAYGSGSTSLKLNSMALISINGVNLQCTQDADSRRFWTLSVQCHNGGFVYAAQKYMKGSHSPAGVYQSTDTGNANCPGGNPPTVSISESPP